MDQNKKDKPLLGAKSSALVVARAVKPNADVNNAANQPLAPFVLSKFGGGIDRGGIIA